MNKQKASGGRMDLISLTGLVFMAVLVGGVTWLIWINKNDTSVAHELAAKRMKVPPMQEAQRIKIPPAPSQMGQVQPPVEPAQAQATVKPMTSAVMPDLTPPQEEIEPTAMPAPQHEQETLDAVALDKTPSSDAATGDTPAPKMAEVVQTVHESSQTPSPGASSKKTPQPAPATATITERYNLQVGAFRVESYAREMVTRLSKKRYAPFILEITDARQRTWYTVRIGRYENRETAAASLESLKRKENIAAVIAKAFKL